MATLSVIIITKNEAHDIRACLESVKWVDEIIVLDSGSTDDTVAICREYTNKVFITDWPGYGPQKNRALAYATGDWVLSLDADEQLSPALQAEIKTLLGQPLPSPPATSAGQALAEGEKDFLSPPCGRSRSNASSPHTGVRAGLFRVTGAKAEKCLEGAERVCLSPIAYSIPRVSTYCGKIIRYGDWRKDHCKRLFKRGQAKFQEAQVHESLQVDGKLGRLSGHLLHATFKDLEEMLHKLNQFSSLSAQMRQQQGRNASVWTAIIHGLWTFLRGYFLRLGFLDGREGFILAVSNAEGSYYRYLKLMYLK